MCSLTTRNSVVKFQLHNLQSQQQANWSHSDFPANSLISTNCSRQYTNQFYTNNMSKESSNLVDYPGKTVLFMVQQIAPSFKNKEPEIPAQSDNKFQQLSEQFPNNSLANQSSQLSIKQHQYVQKSNEQCPKGTKSELCSQVQSNRMEHK